jgi:tetratricopeptide (TPR) repeat protein
MSGSSYNLLADLLAGPGAILVLIGQAFWLWMLIDCMKAEGPRSEWRYILFFGNVMGALAYFVVRWLPNNPLAMPEFMRRWTYKQKLYNAKAAARNIGNPYQYTILGDTYMQMGDRKEAQTAYSTALDKEQQNVNALWGLAQIAMEDKQYDVAKNHLTTLMKLDPEARFGEVSLLYAKARFELKEWAELKAHLKEDIRFWGHPESAVMLATILQQDKEADAARDCLESMIAKVEASPMYHHRRHQPTLRKARKLLKTL